MVKCTYKVVEREIVLFKIGEKVVYGKTGVCEIVDVCDMAVPASGKKQPYYKMKPVSSQNNTVYAPINSDKVFIRSVMSREEALHLISLIPSVRSHDFSGMSQTEIREYYKDKLNSHKISDLTELAISIYSKNKDSGKKTGTVDMKYKSEAETLLHGELAEALGISESEVPNFIAERVKDAERSD